MALPISESGRSCRLPVNPRPIRLSSSEAKSSQKSFHICRALRRRHCVGGIAPVNFGRRRRARRRSKKICGGGIAAWAVKFSNFPYLFKTFFSQELLLSRYTC